MSDEHDSWFSNTFGIDLGGAAKRIEDEARAAAKRIEDEARAAQAQVSNIVQTVQKKVDGAIDEAVGAVTGVVKKVAAATGGGGAGGGGAPKPGAKSGGGTGKFPLSGSVGRGGQNDTNDVKAVQRALGVADDGQCGGGTITAIENFQRSIGQSKPDGRVDAGGATERALAGGGKGAAASGSAAGGNESDDLLGKALAGAKGLAGAMAGAGLGGLAGGLPGKVIELGQDLGGGLAGGLAGGLPGLGDPGGLLGGGVTGGSGGAQANLGSFFDTKSPTKEGLIKNTEAIRDVYVNKLGALFNKSLEELKALEQAVKQLPAFADQLMGSPSFGMLLAVHTSFDNKAEALKKQKARKAFDEKKAAFQQEFTDAFKTLRDYEEAIQKWNARFDDHRLKATVLKQTADGIRSGLHQLSEDSHKLNDRIAAYNKSIAARAHGQLGIVIIKDLGLGNHHDVILFDIGKALDKNAIDLKEEKDNSAMYDKVIKENSEKLRGLKFGGSAPKKK